MDSALQNKYFVSAASIMLITTSGLLKPIFPAKMLKNTFVKAAIVYAVFYMVDKNVTLSVLLTVAYLTSLNIIEGLEEGKEGSENVLDEVEEEVEPAAEEVESAVAEVLPVLEAAGAAPGSEAAEVEPEMAEVESEVEEEPATVVDALKAVTKKAVKKVKKVIGFEDDDDNYYKEVDDYPTRKPRKFPVPFKQEHKIKGIISNYTDTGYSF